MAGEFRKIVNIDALDGGLNVKYEPSILDPIDSPDCLNVVFDDLGGVATRNGSAKLNTSSVGSFACDGLYTTRFNNGTSTMVAFFGGTMWQMATTTFTTVPSAQSVFTASNKVDYTEYQNIMFMGNGGVTPYKYNGTEFTRHGIPVPNSVPAAATTSAGVLLGVYSYKVVYVNSYSAFGNPSAATTTFTAAASSVVGLTSIPVAPISFGVNARRLYRTTNSGTTWLFLTTIADNTTTTYADNTPDASLGASAPANNDAPSLYKYVCTFQERLFTVDDTNPMYVNYSELGEPFYFPVTNFFKIGDGDGEIITGVKPHGNGLMVYKNNSVWVIYMENTDPTNWRRIQTNAKYGGASHRGIVDYDSLQMFLATRFNKPVGFAAIQGASIVPDNTQLTVNAVTSEFKSDKIEPHMANIQTTYIRNVAAIDWKNKVWIAVTYSDSQTTNNRIYQFDYQRRTKDRTTGSWVPFTGMNISCFTIYNNKLYGGDSTATGFVYELDQAGTFSDSGTAINSYFWTKEFEGPMGDKDWQKDYRFANFLIELLGNYLIRFRYRVNSDDSVGNQIEIDTNAGGSNWNGFAWGVGNWGGAKIRENIRLSTVGSGKRIQFYFDNYNTAGRAFHVVRGNFYYNKRGLR